MSRSLRLIISSNTLRVFRSIGHLQKISLKTLLSSWKLSRMRFRIKSLNKSRWASSSSTYKYWSNDKVCKSSRVEHKLLLKKSGVRLFLSKKTLDLWSRSEAKLTNLGVFCRILWVLNPISYYSQTNQDFIISTMRLKSSWSMNLDLRQL